MKKLNAAVERFVRNHPRFGIPNLMMYVVGANAIVYLLTVLAGYEAVQFLAFDWAAIKSGELWRLVTFLIMPGYTSSRSAVWLLIFLYFCVLASLLFIILKLPKFFSFAFTPGFAGMTFPMAIGIVASTKMAGYLTGAGQEALAGVVKQISGIQIYLTTMIVGYVLLNFVIMALRVKKPQ